MIKAIDTAYNGYKFRSRLEARWAVFLDTLGIVYQYEPEGFDLPSGRYLPDFWLPYPPDLNFSGYPNAGCWLEVKGQRPADEEILKLLELSQMTKHSGILVVGMPGEQERFFTHRSGNHGWCNFPSPFGKKDNFQFDLFLMIQQFTNNIGLIGQAVLAARQARFEFGENGK